MIVKVQHSKKGEIGVYTEEIYSNVERIFKRRDSVDDEYMELEIKGEEGTKIVPITTVDDEGNHFSLVSAVWLMNDEGKTIEKLY